MNRKLRSKIRQFFLGWDNEFEAPEPLFTIPARVVAFLLGKPFKGREIVKVPPQRLPIVGESMGELASVGAVYVGDKQDMDGVVTKPRRRPQPSAIQKLFTRWLDARQEEGKSLPYPLYGIARFGFWDAMWRTWVYHVHPKNSIEWLAKRIRAYHLIDRRKRGYGRTVYAVDRDGDLYLVECPQCHDTQSLFFNRHTDEERVWFDESMPDRVFHCSRCSIIFSVYLEDGLRKIRDHRTGNPPIPTRVVRDDMGAYHLGISVEAPWWWKRYEIWPDLQNEGKKAGYDAHGHYPYKIEKFERPHHELGGMANSQPLQAQAETPQPSGEAQQAPEGGQGSPA